MEQWDQDYVHTEETGHVTFEKRGSGGFHFGCVDAALDWRYDDSISRVDFTFEGSDEGDQVTGRGLAKNPIRRPGGTRFGQPSRLAFFAL